MDWIQGNNDEEALRQVRKDIGERYVGRNGRRAAGFKACV
jgi:hypothetical protein